MSLTQDKGGLGLAQMSLAIARVRCQCQYLEYQHMDQNHAGPIMSRREAECGRDESFRKAMAC